MTTIITLQSSDLISNSRADINTSLENLNSDKIETSYLDTDNTLAANSDVKIPSQKAVKTYVDTGGNVNASETSKGIVEEATNAEVTAGTATGGTGAKLIVTPAKLATYLGSKIKFGGTGADGALTISSGTTDIDLGGVAVVIKNYTSISITGTGKLTFSNPNSGGTVIILKSQGNVTLTSSQAPMIDASGLGAVGGVGVQAGSSSQTTGGSGTDGSSPTGWVSKLGTGGIGGTGTDGTGGSALLISNKSYINTAIVKEKYSSIMVGAGGGAGGARAGGSSSAKGGDGGAGGGALVIECAGDWNFTTTSGISVAGKNGLQNNNGSGTTWSSGGGGGGGGGFFLGIYNTLTANSGTITISAGSGVAATFGSGSAGAPGGGGGAGGVSSGSNGSGGVDGGNGGGGTSLVIANTEFT